MFFILLIWNLDLKVLIKICKKLEHFGMNGIQLVFDQVKMTFLMNMIFTFYLEHFFLLLSQVATTTGIENNLLLILGELM